MLLILRTLSNQHSDLIPQEAIQQILSRIDIIDIVGTFVKLKKRGANYLGLCPFHNEKSPSFTVSPAKEIYKCFGCGKSGNGIGFIMEHEKYSYVEALKWLAAKYNVEIEEVEVSPELKQKQLAADSLFIINNFAKDFFAKQLVGTDEGVDVALAYLKERGFREDIINRFQIGYDPASGVAFSKAATDARYDPALLQKSGLVVLRNEALADNYRGRIIFPIHNQSGKVLGFGARLIKNNDKAPKYINTPENEIYVKSKILYGVYFARQAIDKADECLLVEGYTDVVSLHQAGIENVVASGGTSLTVDQLRLVKKYTNNLTIIYDGDGAGVKAALRGLDLALEEGLQVKLVLIPDKEDPDSYVNKIGATGFKEFVANNKKDFILFQLTIALQDAGNDASVKQKIVGEIAETISKINKTEEFTRRQDYVRQVAEILKIEEAGLNNLVNKIIRDKISKTENAYQPENVIIEPAAELDSSIESLLSKDDLSERALVRSLLEFGLKPWNETQRVADFLFKEIAENDLDALMANKDLLNIYTIYVKAYQNGEEPDAKTFLYYDDAVISKLVIEIMDVPAEISPNWKNHYEGKIPGRADLFKEEVISTLTYLKLKKIKAMIAENQKELEGADGFDEQMLIMQTHQHLKQLEIKLVNEVGTVIFK